MDAKNYKNVYPKVFDFCKILKCATKYYQIPKFVLFCFVLYKMKILTDKATIKSWNRRWAWSTSKAYIKNRISNFFNQIADLPEPIADGCIVVTNITGIFYKYNNTMK